MHLLQTESTPSTLSLYSHLTLLLSPILHQPLAPIPPIATYLASHLWPALQSQSQSQSQLQLADIILDLVWQLDTQIDSAILRRPAPLPASTPEQQQQQQLQQDAMHLDDQHEGPIAESTEQDKQAKEAAKANDEAARFLKLETAARERLAEFVKLLIVSPAGSCASPSDPHAQAS